MDWRVDGQVASSPLQLIGYEQSAVLHLGEVNHSSGVVSDVDQDQVNTHTRKNRKIGVPVYKSQAQAADISYTREEN